MKKKLTMKPLETASAGRALFLCCFILYAIVYCGRLNYSAALAEIVPSGLFEKDEAGLVSSALFIAYGGGMFINGFLSDKMPPFALVGGCTLLSAIANLAMYFVCLAEQPALWAMILIWTANGYIQSSIWPTMIRIVSTALPESMRVPCSAAMMATTALGTSMSYLISQQVIRMSGWRELFLVPGILLGAAAIVWLLLTAKPAKACCAWVDAAPAASRSAEEKKSDRTELFRLLKLSGAITMICPIIMMAIVKDGIITWTPTMLTEIFQVEAEFSVAVSTLIPFISIFGAMLANAIMRHFLRDEMKSSALLFSCSALTMVLAGTLGYMALPAMLIPLAVTILFMLGINTLQISLVPLHFAKYGKAATVTGVLNSTASISCGISSYLAGLLAKHSGWQITILIWAALCVIGAVVSAAVVRRWMRFKGM